MCARLSTVMPYKQDPTQHTDDKIQLNNSRWYENKNAIDLWNDSGHAHWFYKIQNFSVGVSLIPDRSKYLDSKMYQHLLREE